MVASVARRRRAFAGGQGRLGQGRPETLQLRCIAADPGLQVKAGDQVADPATAVLGGLHVGRQPLGEMGHAVGQRIAERRQQAGEDHHRPGGHNGHRPAAAPDPPPLQGHHQGIQEQADEAGDRDHQQDVADPVRELAREVGEDHDGHSGEDGGQRDAAPGRGIPQASVPDPGVVPGVGRGGIGFRGLDWSAPGFGRGRPGVGRGRPGVGRGGPGFGRGGVAWPGGAHGCLPSGDEVA